jgi:hypothetical protein
MAVEREEHEQYEGKIELVLSWCGCDTSWCELNPKERPGEWQSQAEIFHKPSIFKEVGLFLANDMARLFGESYADANS